MKHFELLEGEKTIQKIKPERALKKYLFVMWLFPLFILSIFVSLFLGLPILIATALFSEAAAAASIFLSPALFLIVWFGLAWLLASLVYDKYLYWITNKRVLAKRGILGYRIISIPYERISDIIVSRSFIERIFGIASLHIQTLAGQISPGRLGSEGNLLAIPNPEATQKLILDLIKKKRKEEKLTM